eukprot:TRINITY_DN304_c0_g1_i1.p1 TRINITY_DN304_c0_g1~~TRINITY_DN304_c0_g1_i1.p1  ORF type:complete len:172 (+),score=32.46 TRINITY_DN304_c0_g1_i1:94-609(+)
MKNFLVFICFIFSISVVSCVSSSSIVSSSPSSGNFAFSRGGTFTSLFDTDVKSSRYWSTILDKSANYFAMYFRPFKFSSIDFYNIVELFSTWTISEQFFGISSTSYPDSQISTVKYTSIINTFSFTTTEYRDSTFSVNSPRTPSSNTDNNTSDSGTRTSETSESSLSSVEN